MMLTVALSAILIFFLLLEDRTFIPILYIVLRGRLSCCTCSVNMNIMGYEDILYRMYLLAIG